MDKINKIKKRWQEEDENAIHESIAALMKHPQGRKFLWWLLQVGGVGSQPFSGNALQTSFNCGVLNVGNQILEKIVSTSSEGYLEMMKESEDERRKRDAELRAV